MLVAGMLFALRDSQCDGHFHFPQQPDRRQLESTFNSSIQLPPHICGTRLVEYAGGADVDNSAAIQAAGGDAVLTGVAVRHSASDGIQVYNDADVQIELPDSLR